MPPKKAAAKKAATRRSPAKKSTARKSTAKKAAAKRTVARKSVARRTTTAKKSGARKVGGVKRSVAKKASGARKTAARKTSRVKKTAARKTASAKKSVARKTSAAKKTAKKTVKKTVKTVGRTAAPKKAAPAKKATKKQAAKKLLPAATLEGVTGASADALEVLVADHLEVDQLFTQFEAASPNSEVAKELADKIVRELSVHAAIEEMVLYPIARRSIGDDLVNHAIDEHNEVKELLAEVDGKPVGDEKVRRTFYEIKLSVEEHVHEEETDLFPRLRGAISQEDLQRMGRALEGAKAVAPTHPHPHAPDRPPGNIVVGPAVGLLDRVRDVARQAMS